LKKGREFNRVTFNAKLEFSDLINETFVKLITGLHDGFHDRILGTREERISSINKALNGRRDFRSINSPDVSESHWEIPNLPDELKNPGIEISGPAHVTPMFINALNPGPDGYRAEGYLDDDEDSASHRLDDSFLAAVNRKNAIDRTLKYQDKEKNKIYSIQDGKTPFFMHRERGLHLDEKDFRIDGVPVSATLLSTALTLFYAGQSQAAYGQGIYFYIPKTESPQESALYKDIFDECRNRIDGLQQASIKAILLVESLPMVYCMEESLYKLGDYGAGLNAARWDLKASLLEYAMADVNAVWPDRFGVDIKNTPFIANIFRRLIAICNKRSAVPIGGMATTLPHRNQKINEQASEAIRLDKQWESEEGFVRAWVAHIYHMSAAAQPFKQFPKSSKFIQENSDPEKYPVKIETPKGDLTMECTRQNARVMIEYVEGWLNGRGAKGIDRLAGRPGERPALMEDLATARMSVAQIAQRLVHEAKCEETGQTHDRNTITNLLANECEDIILNLGKGAKGTDISRYKHAMNISMKWIKNYTEFDFRSLGTYSVNELKHIGSEDQKL
jgi:malate synthase